MRSAAPKTATPRPAQSRFLSPRDCAGHGSHTAGTAAGVPVDASIAGTPIGQVSGMAPAARLAIYKAVWHVAPGVGAGGTTNLLKAIDDAVTYGVDVINFSIGDGFDEIDPTDTSRSSTPRRQCHVDALDSSKVTGKVVLCRRGENAKAEKS
ncbi:S8 family serine peptidase [Nonomuraea diastatica]|uniref:Peptidase S8/S53 domain-containing protein n=1 Tax=Nonomuraea diastatica TaxID=1848329 RepID=A0A4R4W3W3_9ACTN|nr:S8 family serine peptidase [Nonomuraea diastatica]TDD07720.1 hypothetical protein E1294_48065 [Nonomuraea diastatica]